LKSAIRQTKVEIFKPPLILGIMMKWWYLIMPMKFVLRRCLPANIAILAQGCDVVGIDEAQFFDDEIVRVCNDLANQESVSLLQLDMDFKGTLLAPCRL
jgi:hypothetical protein